jgi:hypothetical protein
MRLSRFVAACILTASMTTVGLLAGATSALASSCDSRLETFPEIGLDFHRAVAWCSSIDADYKARPKLVRDGGPDYTGPWFTRLNTEYATDTYTCYLGCHSAYQVAHV